LAAIAAFLLFATPVLAGQTKPAKPDRVKMGEGYDLPRRDRRAGVPRVQATAKLTTLTDAMVAKVAKQRRDEVAYCWERLPRTQRIAGTAVLHFAIAPGGTVESIEVNGDAPAEAASCIAELAHNWMFPAVDTKSSIDYPIRLRDR